MNITSILRSDAILPELKAKDKQGVIQELAGLIAQVEPSIDVEQLVKILLEREALGSTGIGSGVAIPHGKLSQLDHIVAAFGRSKPGVEFDSQDGEPAHLFFALVAPENTAGLHLKALAKLSRLLKESSFRDRLMKAPDTQTVYQIIKEEDEKS
jgi:Phosphotransferase system mannitol/fructose-specific IIA domain (Ntr-type)